MSIPPKADKLRPVISLAQSPVHALTVSRLSFPNLPRGRDSDPAQCNILGVMAQAPAMARDGILPRHIGQTISETLGGKKLHPTWVVPGGVNQALAEDQRQTMLQTQTEPRSTAPRMVPGLATC